MRHAVSQKEKLHPWSESGLHRQVCTQTPPCSCFKMEGAHLSQVLALCSPNERALLSCYISMETHGLFRGGGGLLLLVRVNVSLQRRRRYIHSSINLLSHKLLGIGC